MSQFQATPTLVIGLGGTGLKAATYIKKSLLEANQNQLPRGMAILVLDTERDIKFQAGGWGEARGPNHATGPVKIKHGEYMGLTGKVIDLGQSVKKEQIEARANPNAWRSQPHRHISSWFQAQHYIDTVNVDGMTWNLEVGAGRYRQFGRLGLFNRIEETKDMLKGAMQAVHQMGGSTLYVHIIGSLAGGTGAALFIDVAHLVKQIAPQGPTPVVLGHFVLAEGFRGTPEVNFSNSKVEGDFNAKCFAALRELTRLQGPVDKTGGYQIVYDPKGAEEMIGTLNSKLYSAVYLYDGSQTNNPLNIYPVEKGLAPAIADVVVAYIDDRSGSAFCSHAVNYNAFYDAFSIPKGSVTYGSVGVYTIELPIYHITEGWAHKLAVEFFDALLLPGERDGQLPMGLIDNQPGGKETEPLKAARKWLDEETTPLIGRLAEWGRESSRTDQRQREVIDDILAMKETVWQQELAPSDPRFIDYVSQAQAELDGSLGDRQSVKYYVEYKVSGKSAAQKAGRLQEEVESRLQMMVGRADGWRREGGDFGRALTRLGNHHVKEFERSLEKWVNTHLNGGQVGDAIARKGGKLGFVKTFLTELAATLAHSVHVLDEAEKKSRSGRKPVYDALERERKDMAAKMYKKSGLFSGNLKAYRQKSNELAQFHKADIARQVVRGLVARIYRSVSQLLDEVALWEQVLARAGSADGGAYALVLQGQAEVIADRDRSKNAARWVIDDNEKDDELGLRDDYISDKYKRYAGDQTEKLLDRVEWRIGRRDDSEDFQIDFLFEGQPWSRRAGQSKQREAGLKNVSQLLNACRAAYALAWSEMSVVEYLKQNFYDDGDKTDKLAQKVHENCDYLLSRTNSATPPTMRATFVRVYQDNLGDQGLAFLRRLRQEVATLYNETTEANKKAAEETGADYSSDTGHNSRDPFKLTFVMFGDLLQPEKIKGFKDGRNSYRSVTGSGSQWRELHILPAETHALEVEKDIDKGIEGLRQRRRELDEEVVAVMEDMDRFRLAMRCLAYGETDYYWDIMGESGLLLHKYTPPISKNPSSYSYWRLTVIPVGELRSDGKIYDRTGLARPEHYQLTDMSDDPDLLQAFIQLAIKGLDRKDKKPINWQRVDQTLEWAMARHLEVWRERGDIGWRLLPSKSKSHLDEGEDKAAQVIRLSARMAEIKRELDEHKWAWSPSGETTPPEISGDNELKRRKQREVDLRTAIWGVADKEKERIERRVTELGNWVGGTPNELVALTPIAPGDLVEPVGWICSNGHENDLEARFCKECGAPQPRPEPIMGKEDEASPVPAAAALVCEDGHEMQPEWQNCPFCGKPPQQEDGRVVCQNGHEMEPEWQFCPVCRTEPV